MFLYSILTIKNLGMSKHEGKFNFKYLRKYQNYDKNIQLYNFGFGDRSFDRSFELHSFLIPALILSTDIHKISIAFMIEEWNACTEKGSSKNKTKAINKITEMKFYKITNR